MERIENYKQWKDFCNSGRFVRAEGALYLELFICLQYAELRGFLYYSDALGHYAPGAGMTKELLALYFGNVYDRISGESKKEGQLRIPWVVLNALFDFKEPGLRKSWHDIKAKAEKNSVTVEGVGPVGAYRGSSKYQEVLASAMYVDLSGKTIISKTDIDFYLDRTFELMQYQKALEKLARELEQRASALEAEEQRGKIHSIRRKMWELFGGSSGMWKDARNFLRSGKRL